jgi:hypothetical protein
MLWSFLWRVGRDALKKLSESKPKYISATISSDWKYKGRDLGPKRATFCVGCARGFCTTLIRENLLPQRCSVPFGQFFFAYDLPLVCLKEGIQVLIIL